MSPKMQTGIRKVFDSLGATITQRIMTAVSVFLVAFVATAGKSMVHQVAYNEIANSPKVKALDSAGRAMDIRINETSEKVDSVNSKVEKLDDKVDTFIEVMGEAFPQFKQAAKAHRDREKENDEVRQSLGAP